MVMLHVFNRLKDEHNLKLYVLTYDHRWRKESYIDIVLVRKYCLKNKLVFIHEIAKGKPIKKEDAAREQRYSFLKEAARKFNLHFICTAHHKDDQVETILFRLARGTGSLGLLPIKRISELTKKTKIFRPLLEFSKEQIIQYAKENKVSFVNDETNFDTNYKRNLIRIKIIPLLKSINTGFGDNILLFSKLVYSQNEALNGYFSTLFKKMPGKNKLLTKNPRIEFDKKIFMNMNSNVQKAFIYWLLSNLKIQGSISKIDYLLNLIRNAKKTDLSLEYVLSVDKSKIIIEKKSFLKLKKTTDKKLNLRFQLNGMKKIFSLEKNKRLIIELFKKKNFNKNFPKDKEKAAFVNLKAYKDKHLTLRYRQSRDVFQPLGLDRTIKLKNYLINKKISKEKRYNLPLLCSGQEVLWLPGYSLSQKIKVLDKPTHILKLQELKN